MARRRTRGVLRLYERDGVTVGWDSDISRNFEELEEYVRSKVIRSAARAGILAFYNEMKRLAPVKRGVLRDSIYHWYDLKQSTDTTKIYATGPNKKKAPHWHWVEFGNAMRPANPYIRPVWMANQERARTAAMKRARERMDEFFAGRMA